jgi:hypothetical protein
LDQARKPRFPRSRPGLLPASSAAVLLVVLLSLPSIPSGAPRTPDTPFARAASGSTPNDSLRPGPLLAVTPSTFWSIDLQTNNSSGVRTDPAVGSFLNSTPVTWSRYGQDTEACNITVNILYADNGTPSGPCNYNLTAYGAWCLSQRPQCRSVVFLPGESNNSAETAYTAAWVVRTLGFQPNYFNIGNEPSLWKHYGISWTHWNVTDHSRPTSLDYAFDVRSAISAVRAVDPGAKFIGIEATCACGATWFQDLMRIDGGLISAISYHSYPSKPLVNESAAQFLAPLFSPDNITATYPLVRSYIQGRCHRCDTIPIFLSEYNAGPGWTPSVLNGTYTNALFLGASVVQALRANVTQLTIFNLQSNKSTYGYSMMNNTNVVGPTGELFSGLLRHLARGAVYGTEFNTSVGGVVSVLTEGPRMGTLLVVNTNLSQAVNFSVGGVFATGAKDSIGRWAPGLATPTWARTLGVTNYTVPAEGMLLLSVPLNATFAAPVSGRVQELRGTMIHSFGALPVVRSPLGAVRVETFRGISRESAAGPAPRLGGPRSIRRERRLG